MYVKAPNDDSFSTGRLFEPSEVEVKIDKSSPSVWPVDVMVTGTNGRTIHTAYTVAEAEEIARGILAALETEVMA